MNDYADHAERERILEERIPVLASVDEWQRAREAIALYWARRECYHYSRSANRLDNLDACRQDMLCAIGILKLLGVLIPGAPMPSLAQWDSKHPARHPEPVPV